MADDVKPSERPFFEDGQSQIVSTYKHDWIIEDLFVETEFDSDSDGVRDRMHVSVTRPRAAEASGIKLPVIYQSSPYYAGMGSNASSHMWNPRQELNTAPVKHDTPPAMVQKSLRPKISSELTSVWVPRGFIVVHSCSPGTGLSQGCPTVGGDNESLAPKAVIDWLCGRARGFKNVDDQEPVIATWCNGKVGMIGTSYNGTLALAAAITGVEGLKCIVPIAPNTSYYHYYRSNGLVRHPGGYRGEDIDVLYDFIDSGYADKREYCDCHVRDGEMLEQFDRTNGDYNAFWAGRDYLRKMDGMRAALLMSHAFNDWNVMPEHSYRISQAAKQRSLDVQTYYHQGGHGGQPPMTLLNRWFSHYLFEVDNGIEKESTSWIVREGNRMSKPDAYVNYPHPEALMVELAPIAAASSTSENAWGQLIVASELVKTPNELSDIAIIVDDHNVSGSELAKLENSSHRLLYTTSTLTQDVHISGVARVTIRLACDRPSACLSVWLVSLPWTDSKRITDDVITRGWADPTNADSIEVTTPMVPGEFRDVTFDLQPDDQVIAKGEQIGLMIFSSDHDFTLWPEPGTQLQFDLNGTSLMLPIVGGLDRFQEALK
jgi:X-Pro dipeptidyl-peptidase